MDRKKMLAVLLLVFAVVLGGAYILYRTLGENVTSQQLASQSPSQPELPLAPDFTVYDSQGQPVRLSDYLGKPIVLNFWASWCGPCQMEMPHFQAKYNDLGQQVEFLMINMADGYQETVDSATAFLQQKGYTFPVFFDTQSSAALAYGAYSLPTTYFINAQGYAVAQAKGAISADTLQRGIDMILE